MNLVIALTKTPITRLEISHWDLFVAIEIQKTRLSTASIFRHTHTTLNVYISSYVGEYGIYVKKQVVMVHKYLLNIVNFVSCFHLTDLEY